MLDLNIKAATFFFCGVIFPPFGSLKGTEAPQTCIDISRPGLLNLLL